MQRMRRESKATMFNYDPTHSDEHILNAVEAEYWDRFGPREKR